MRGVALLEFAKKFDVDDDSVTIERRFLLSAPLAASIGQPADRLHACAGVNWEEPGPPSTFSTVHAGVSADA